LDASGNLTILVRRKVGEFAGAKIIPSRGQPDRHFAYPLGSQALASMAHGTALSTLPRLARDSLHKSR
jgi:hypothetical protein